MRNETCQAHGLIQYLSPRNLQVDWLYLNHNQLEQARCLVRLGSRQLLFSVQLD